MKFLYDEDDGFGIALSDVLIGFVAVLLIHFSPVKNIHKPGVEPGNICADISWPDDRDVDLDLWGKGPNGVAVSYRHPHDTYLDLLRDVVGFYGNPSHRNYEIMCGGQLKDGGWTFNVSYYGKHDTKEDAVPVKMSVWVKDPNDPTNTKTIYTETMITPSDLEKTLFDFKLSSDGKIIDSSVNHRYVKMRT